MEKFKEFMKRIGDLINSFANPVSQEQSFDELVVAAGIGEDQIKTLKESMNGISWDKFAREEDNIKKSRMIHEKADVNKLEVQRVITRTDKGIDRD